MKLKSLERQFRLSLFKLHLSIKLKDFKFRESLKLVVLTINKVNIYKFNWPEAIQLLKLLYQQLNRLPLLEKPNKQLILRHGYQHREPNHCPHPWAPAQEFHF